jgi:hypothetical protein
MAAEVLRECQGVSSGGGGQIWVTVVLLLGAKGVRRQLAWRGFAGI